MTRSRRWTALLWAAVPYVAASACFDAGDLTFGEGDDDLILLGTITASTSTTGPSPDADGYIVRLDESRMQPIDINGGVTFDGLRLGGWSVTLEGYASNCVIAGSNPVDVTVRADSLAQAHFDVTCS